MIDKNLPVVQFPMKIYWGEDPKTTVRTEKEAIKVTAINYPQGNFKKNCYRMIMSTWESTPVKDATDEEVNKAFIELLTGKVLPNSMESLVFTFLVEGLTHIEISHMLRHRQFFSTHALCSGDRDLRHDDIMIPESIRNSVFADQYIELSLKCKHLYAQMVDSKEISLMDARYILNRNHTYYYYFSMNLRDLIGFINQRKCSAIQPYTDNLIAHGMYNEICKYIPEFAKVVSLKCGPKCHFIVSAAEKNTRIYQPDKAHAQYMDFNPDNFVYSKTRPEMGIPNWVQDE